jgi:hypothetical protein
MPAPLYPEIEVRLSGADGNAFAVLGAVSKALRRQASPEAAEAFLAEATAGDYDALLATAFRYVEVA